MLEKLLSCLAIELPFVKCVISLHKDVNVIYKVAFCDMGNPQIVLGCLKDSGIDSLCKNMQVSKWKVAAGIQE